METFGHFVVPLDPGGVAERLRFDPARGGFESLEELLRMARTAVSPKAVFEVADVELKGEGTVGVSGAAFSSPILRKNLNGVDRVFPYIITIGPELERVAAAQSDLLKQYYLEEIANIALDQAADWLAKQLEARYGATHLSNMSPGSLDDWPITEQAKLFSIFGDTEKLVGVRLTDSMLMIPRKSVSGILFPSEVGFVACQLCGRERCPGRKAAFDAGTGT